MAALDLVVDGSLAPGDERHLQALVVAGAPYTSNMSSVVIDGGSTVIEDITSLVEGGKIYRDNPASGLDWDVDPFGLFHKPDVYFILWIDGVYAGGSGTSQDTRYPTWDVAADLTIPEGSVTDDDDDDGFAWQGGDDYLRHPDPHPRRPADLGGHRARDPRGPVRAPGDGRRGLVTLTTPVGPAGGRALGPMDDDTFMPDEAAASSSTATTAADAELTLGGHTVLPRVDVRGDVTDLVRTRRRRHRGHHQAAWHPHEVTRHALVGRAIGAHPCPAAPAAVRTGRLGAVRRADRSGP